MTLKTEQAQAKPDVLCSFLFPLGKLLGPLGTLRVKVELLEPGEQSARWASNDKLRLGSLQVLDDLRLNPGVRQVVSSP